MFDGYLHEPATKDTAHLKRTKGEKKKIGKVCLEFQNVNEFSLNEFLLNKLNQQEFLRHLTKYMNCHGIKSVQ